MKVILFLLCLLPYSCWATAANQLKQEFIDSFAHECGFQLGDKLASKIIDYRKRGAGSNGEAGAINYSYYDVYSQTKTQNKTRTIKFLLRKTCPTYEIELRKIDPILVIKEEENGIGTYSHIKWQKTIPA